MTTFYAGKFYPPNPNSRVWKGGRFVDGVSATGILPGQSSLIGVGDVDGLQDALDDKSNVGHQHSVADINPTPLTTNVDGGTFF